MLLLVVVGRTRLEEAVEAGRRKNNKLNFYKCLKLSTLLGKQVEPSPLRSGELSRPPHGSSLEFQRKKSLKFSKLREPRFQHSVDANS